MEEKSNVKFVVSHVIVTEEGISSISSVKSNDFKFNSSSILGNAYPRTINESSNDITLP